jgi:hypothetical protein
MLILPIHTRGDVIALQDDAVATGFRVALARPRLARRTDGSLRIRLVRWTPADAAAAREATVGGRLTLDVELQPSPAELTAAGFAPADTLPMPWLDAKVRLDGPQFDPVEAEVSCALGTATAMSVDLTPDAAALLAPLLQSDTISPLQVAWLGRVLVRLPPVEVIATADINEVRRRLDMVEPGRHLTVTRSIIDANARIEIRGADNPALELALREWVLEELTRRLASGQALNVRASASEVVQWPIHLATTLDALAPGRSRQSLVETVILDRGDVGALPPIEVRPLADFSGLLERLDVRLAAEGSDTVVELSFVNDTPRPASLGTRTFRWSHRLKLRNRPSGEWSAWQEVRESTALLVPVSIPSQLRVEVLAAGIDFRNRWASVRVVLTHAVPGMPETSHAVELTLAQPAATWTSALDGVRGSLSARLTYVSRQGQSLEKVVSGITGDQLIVTDPLEGECIKVALVPAGTGWDDVALAMVDLRYVDGAYSVEEAVELRRLDDFVEWEIPARAGGSQRLEWRLHTSLASGRFQSGPWQAATPGIIVVRIDGVPRRNIQILPIYFDTSVTPSATLQLRSAAQTERIVLTSRAERTVAMDAGAFAWTIQWTTADGTQLPESPPDTGDDVIVVPRFRRA